MIVRKLRHQRVAFENLLNDASLHSRAAAMDEPNFPETRGVGCVQVLFDDRRDVAGCEGVEIQHRFNRYAERVLFLQIRGCRVSCIGP